MLMISLMLAAAPTSAVKPEVRPRREVVGSRAAGSAIRSKRLIELEAAVKSLPVADAEPSPAAGPKGM